MAKDEDKDTGASQFTAGTIDMGHGIVVATKLRVGGMLYLEEQFDKPMDQIDFGRVGDDGEATGVKVGTLMHLLVAMMISHDPDLDPAEAFDRVKRLDQDDLLEVTKAMEQATALPEKNPDRPTTKDKPQSKSD